MTTKSSVLFCPFCRESFEDVERCPEHDVRLVPWDELPPDPTVAHASEDEEMPFWDLRHGRGILYAGVLLVLVGFFAPSVRTSLDPRGASGMFLALTRAPNLWIVPAAAFAIVSIVVRRPTAASLHGARVAIVSLALIAFASMVLTGFRLVEGARLLAERTGHPLHVTPLVGAYLVALGLAGWCVGATRASAR